MRITIIGAGALGTLFGALLAGVADVYMIDRSRETVDAIRRYGLRVSEPEAERQGSGAVQPQAVSRRQPVPARVPFAAAGAAVAGAEPAGGERFTGGPAVLALRGHATNHERTVYVAAATEPGAGADLALVLVKSGGTAWAADMAARALAPHGLALTLQNGLGNRETLAARLGPERVWQGVTAQGATLLGPGRARHAGRGPTHLETRPEIRGRAAEVAALFEKAGIETDLSADLAGLIWGKLAVNAGINALTAILRVPNGALAEIPEARALMLAAASEVGQVAQARGIRLPYASAEERVLEVCRATAGNRSSMLQDVLRGRPTEVDAINAAVVVEAREVGLTAPVNEMLAGLVKAIEQATDRRVMHNQEGL